VRGAVLIVDDAHGLGVVGTTGRGVAEKCSVLGQIDIVTGSLGKALGGISGGFVAGPAALIKLLEQAARAFLFTTAVTPAAAAASEEAIRILRAEPAIVTELQGKVRRFVESLVNMGFQRLHTDSAIVPLMLGDSGATRKFADVLREHGVYASCFVFPVVAEGTARIRFQVSRAHSEFDLAACAAACGAAASEFERR
jgi:glycine C-acetyltransferase